MKKTFWLVERRDEKYLFTSRGAMLKALASEISLIVKLWLEDVQANSEEFIMYNEILSQLRNKDYEKVLDLYNKSVEWSDKLEFHCTELECCKSI